MFLLCSCKMSETRTTKTRIREYSDELLETLKKTESLEYTIQRRRSSTPIKENLIFCSADQLQPSYFPEDAVLCVTTSDTDAVVQNIISSMKLKKIVSAVQGDDTLTPGGRAHRFLLTLYTSNQPIGIKFYIDTDGLQMEKDMNGFRATLIYESNSDSLSHLIGLFSVKN